MATKATLKTQKDSEQKAQLRATLEKELRASLSKSSIAKVKESVESILPGLIEKIIADPKISNEVYLTAASSDSRATSEAKAVAITKSSRRRNVLSAAIEKAQKFAADECKDPWNTALIYAILMTWANEEFPPFLAATDEGLKYQDGNEVKFLTDNHLKQRLSRLKKAL